MARGSAQLIFKTLRYIFRPILLFEREEQANDKAKIRKNCVFPILAQHLLEPLFGPKLP
jgi:hypothetical protein